MSRGKSKGFIIYYDNEIIVSRLSDNEAGKLFKSLFPYATEHIRPDFESIPALAMAFDMLSLAIDRNAEWYKGICNKNRENVLKRWNKGDTTEYDCKQSDTTEYDRVPNKKKEKTKRKQEEREEEREEHIDCQQIADLYNETCVSFPRVIKLSEKRKKAIRARLKTYAIDDFKALFEKAEASDFLKGGGANGWRADFDWMITDKYMPRILEGVYDNKKTQEAQHKPYSEHPMEDFKRETQDDYEFYMKHWGDEKIV